VERVVLEHGVSERLACRALDQHRSTQRKIPEPHGDEVRLTAEIIALAIQCVRYGYRRITKMLWSYDFVEDRTHNGRKYRMLNVIDELHANASRSASVFARRRGSSL